MKLLKCPYCNETLLRNSQGLSIDVKRKHLNKYVKKWELIPLLKPLFKKTKNKAILKLIVDDVVNAQTKVVEVVDEIKRNKITGKV